LNTQTLIIGKRRFVVVPEKDFLRLQRRAGKAAVRPEFAREAVRELQTYRKSRKASNWTDVNRKLGL
jgi:hypothetical protein